MKVNPFRVPTDKVVAELAVGDYLTLKFSSQVGDVRDLVVLGEKHIQDPDYDIFVVFVTENSLEAAVGHQVNITV